MSSAGPDLAAGLLLVATPALADPNFAGTVVLLLDVTDDGALGVVLNRPTAVPVVSVLPVWAEVVAEPEVLFQGGPVETNGALAVALRRTDPPGPRGPGALDDPDAPTSTVGLREVTGRLALLDLDTPSELVTEELAGLRVFAGYAGWGAGQLAAEVEEGSWYVVAGEPGDIFRVDTTSLWRDVLRRQPDELAWHSTRPADVDLN